MELSKIANELREDEKALAAAFGLERFYKKHKTKLWAAVIALVVLFGGRAIYHSIQEAKIASANAALVTLQKHPTDSKALAQLKENAPKLYELYRFAQAAKKRDAAALAQLAKSQEPVISDSARYHAAVAKQQSAPSKLYEDLSLLEEAYEALKAGDKHKARKKLQAIDKRSPAATIAALMMHATIEVK